MKKRLKLKCTKVRFLKITIAIIFVLLLSAQPQKTFAGFQVPLETYTYKIVVGVDDLFLNNEGLFHPTAVRVSPKTGEIFVVDQGNKCVYVFSPEFEFKRKIGRSGQGPGEFSNPQYLDIDFNGDLYVYDVGNSRISLFTNEGELLNSFRIQGRRDLKFVVTSEREIVISSPRDGYYFTVYSREGEILKQIGEVIDYFDGDNRNNRTFANGWPIIDNKGNYVILFQYWHMFKVYDKNGSLILEKYMEKEIDRYQFIDISGLPPAVAARMNDRQIRSPYNKDARGLGTIGMELKYRNSKFYLSTPVYRNPPANDEPKLYFFVLDEDLNLLKHIVVNMPAGQRNYSSGPNVFPVYDIINNGEDIIFPSFNNAELLLISKEKK